MESYDNLVSQYRHEFKDPLNLEDVILKDCSKTNFFKALSENGFTHLNPQNLSLIMCNVTHGFIEDNQDSDYPGYRKLKSYQLTDDLQLLLPNNLTEDTDVYKISRLYDFMTGFHVRDAKDVKWCKFVTIMNSTPIIIDFSDRFNEKDEVHISFLLQNKFTYEKGIQYNFCRGLPKVVLPYSDCYIIMNKSKHKLSVDTLNVASKVRAQFGKDGKDKPLLFTIDNELMCCKGGKIITPDLSHMKEIGKDLCKDVLDRDTSTIVGSYLY